MTAEKQEILSFVVHYTSHRESEGATWSGEQRLPLRGGIDEMLARKLTNFDLRGATFHVDVDGDLVRNRHGSHGGRWWCGVTKNSLRQEASTCRVPRAHHENCANNLRSPAGPWGNRCLAGEHTAI